MPNYRMVPGLVTEELDQEILVCDIDRAVVHRVSGPAADVLRQVIVTDAPVGLADDEVTAGLVAAGVLVAADAPDREVGRRSFVRAAAAVGTAGVVTMALPRAAAAASEDESDGTEPPPSFLPQSDPLTGIGTDDSNRGEVTVFWPSVPGAFTYDYSISVTGSGSGGLSGTLASGSLHTIYTLNINSSVSVLFTSNTSPSKSVTRTESRGAT